MTKEIRYFVAGDPKAKEAMDYFGSYEASFFAMFSSAFGPHVLQRTPEDCKKDHLAHGMDPAFYEKTARIFRVTVEEVPKEEWSKKE